MPLGLWISFTNNDPGLYICYYICSISGLVFAQIRMGVLGDTLATLSDSWWWPNLGGIGWTDIPVYQCPNISVYIYILIDMDLLFFWICHDFTRSGKPSTSLKFWIGHMKVKYVVHKKTYWPTVGQPLVQLGNKCCARVALLAILCLALQIHWVDPWLFKVGIL